MKPKIKLRLSTRGRLGSLPKLTASPLTELLEELEDEDYNPRDCSGDYELRSISCDHSNCKEPIEVILVTGDTSELTGSICETFSHDFSCVYLNVQDYLRELAVVDNTKALGTLHITPLLSILDLGEQPGELFMTPILLFKIDQEVKRGNTRFLITGLDAQMETAMMFEQKIAKPFAMISFKQALTDSVMDVVSVYNTYPTMRKIIEWRYKAVLLSVEVSQQGGPEETYPEEFSVSNTFA